MTINDNAVVKTTSITYMIKYHEHSSPVAAVELRFSAATTLKQ